MKKKPTKPKPITRRDVKRAVSAFLNADWVAYVRGVIVNRDTLIELLCKELGVK